MNIHWKPKISVVIVLAGLMFPAIGWAERMTIKIDDAKTGDVINQATVIFSNGSAETTVITNVRGIASIPNFPYENGETTTVTVKASGFMRSSLLRSVPGRNASRTVRRNQLQRQRSDRRDGIQLRNNGNQRRGAGRGQKLTPGVGEHPG